MNTRVNEKLAQVRAMLESEEHETSGDLPEGLRARVASRVKARLESKGRTGVVTEGRAQDVISAANLATKAIEAIGAAAGKPLDNALTNLLGAINHAGDDLPREQRSRLQKRYMGVVETLANLSKAQQTLLALMDRIREDATE